MVGGAGFYGLGEYGEAHYGGEADLTKSTPWKYDTALFVQKPTPWKYDTALLVSKSTPWKYNQSLYLSKSIPFTYDHEEFIVQTTPWKYNTEGILRKPTSWKYRHNLAVSKSIPFTFDIVGGLDVSTPWKFNVDRWSVAQTKLIAYEPPKTFNRAKVGYNGVPQDNDEWGVFLSPDNGQNWQEFTPGVYEDFTATGSELICRVRGKESTGNYLTRLDVEYEFN